MRVAVVGGGYVGLTTAVALAWIGHSVHIAEVDDAKVATIGSGRAPFFEPGLDDALAACGDRLSISRHLAEAVRGADVCFIAVGTPADARGAPDVSYVRDAFEGILRAVADDPADLVVVNKSTVPVGTSEAMVQRVDGAGLGDHVLIASNPEFLRQGRALQDSLYPDRIVLGGSSSALDVLRRLYEPIAEQAFRPPRGVDGPETARRVPVYEVDRRSAELAKYAANAFLATRISFINEIANVCDLLDADVDAVTRIIGADARIGRHFLHPGVGYGGSCFPKDTHALHHMASESGYDFELLSAVMRVNQRQYQRVLDKLERALDGVRGRRVALMGLAFKPGTDDMRGAPSIPLAHELVARGARVRAHDPQALERARALLPPEVSLVADAGSALRGADAAVLLTEWPEYLALESHEYRTLMRRALVVDGRNALSEAVRSNIEYHGIGRRPSMLRMALADSLAAD